MYDKIRYDFARGVALVIGARGGLQFYRPLLVAAPLPPRYATGF